MRNIGYHLLDILLLPFFAVALLMGRRQRRRAGRWMVAWVGLENGIGRALRMSRMAEKNAGWLLLGRLNRGDSWDEIRELQVQVTQDGQRPNSPGRAFANYLLDEQYEDAREAALLWCETTGRTVAGQEKKMRRFFARWGTDFPAVRMGIIHEEWRNQKNAYNNDPEKRVNPESWAGAWHYAKSGAQQPSVLYPKYYEARLAVELAKWLPAQDRETRSRALAKIREKDRRLAEGVPSFELSEGLARAIGMDEAILEEVRQKVMGAGRRSKEA